MVKELEPYNLRSKLHDKLCEQLLKKPDNKEEKTSKPDDDSIVELNEDSSEEEESEQETDEESGEEEEDPSNTKLNIILTIDDSRLNENEEDEEDYEEEDRNDGMCFCEKPLKLFVVDDEGWWCNTCEENSKNTKVKDMKKDSKMYGCRKCDFDVCEKCYKDETKEDTSIEDLELVNLVLEQSKKLEDKYNSSLIKEIIGLANKRKRAIEKDKEKGEKKLKLANLKEYRKLVSKKANSNEIVYFKNLERDDQKAILSKLQTVTETMNVDMPYRFRILESTIPITFKACALKKLSALKTMDSGSGEYAKLKHWLDTFMQIPFDNYSKIPVNVDNSSKEECHAFMQKSMNILDNAVYGMDDVKLQIMQLVGQWIANPQSAGTAIAIKGPPGTGKTTLVREGISKILNRYFAFMALGGNSDGSVLEGHSFTYEGARNGTIVDILIRGKMMNPIILFDELDKISDTPKGEELTGILTHLTDITQNDKFHDKYFSEIDFDLSKCLFIFCYNDESKINSILKDRMYRIETKGYTVQEKTVIANRHLIPKIRDSVHFSETDVELGEDTIKYIIQQYTQEEKGVRNLKRCIEIVYTKLNLYRLMNGGSNIFKKDMSLNISFPVKVTTDLVQKLIKAVETNSIVASMYM